MTCNDILKSALRLLKRHNCEEEFGEHSERASYILSAMFSEAARIDKLYRSANNLGQQLPFNPTYSELSREFPLCDRFSSAAVFYLAAMLIIDEDSELSDTFYGRYCDSMSSIVSSIPSTIAKTQNVY